jgi:hypothetical protein
VTLCRYDIDESSTSVRFAFPPDITTAHKLLCSAA